LDFNDTHVVAELQNEGFEVVIIDNLSNSSIAVLNGIISITGKLPVFEKSDLRDKAAVIEFFKRHHDVIGVIHFATIKAVDKSVNLTLLHFKNNLNTLFYIL